LAHSEPGARSGRVGARYERWSSIGAAWVVVASGAGLTACTELSAGSDTLDQEVRPNLPDASVGDPRWACLDQPPPNSANPLVPTVDLAMQVADTVTNAIPEKLTARACGKRDVYCDTPLAEPVSPSGDGGLHLSVPQGFDGFLEITSPSTIPTMYFVDRPLMHNTTRSLAIISTLALNGLAMQAGLRLESTLGHVLIYVFDCMGAPASDVQLSNGAGGLPFIFVDGLPNLGQDVTSVQGIGGFVNVTPGYSLLEGRRRSSSQVVGTTNVVVRGGWFSYIDVRPQPL
jgi:hypothetical protein